MKWKQATRPENAKSAQLQHHMHIIIIYCWAGLSSSHKKQERERWWWNRRPQLNYGELQKCGSHSRNCVLSILTNEQPPLVHRQSWCLPSMAQIAPPLFLRDQRFNFPISNVYTLHSFQCSHVASILLIQKWILHHLEILFNIKIVCEKNNYIPPC